MHNKNNISTNDDVILLTVDYAFKKVMHNKTVLKGLLSAVLNIKAEDITEITYLETTTEKESQKKKLGILDLFVKMSNNKCINIEMQAHFFEYWTNRSLYYLTKKFSEQAVREDQYTNKYLYPCISISILDFIWNKDEPSFYNQYYLMNPTSNQMFTDKLVFHTIELPKIVNATDEEKQNPIYRWARFFRSKTWEEYEQCAKGDISMETAVDELKNIHDDQIKMLEYLHRQIEIMDQNQLLEDANTRGYQTGFDSGYNTGYDTGYDSGFDSGYDSGYGSEFCSAVKSFIKNQLLNQADDDAIIKNLIQIFSLTPEKASEFLNSAKSK